MGVRTPVLQQCETYTFNTVEQDYQSGEGSLDVMNRHCEEGWELVTRDDDQGYYFELPSDKCGEPPKLPR